MKKTKNASELTTRTINQNGKVKLIRNMEAKIIPLFSGVNFFNVC